MAAYLASVSSSLSIFKKPQLSRFDFAFSPRNPLVLRSRIQIMSMPIIKSPTLVMVAATTVVEKQKKRYPVESKSFVEEMRSVAMRLHTKDQAKEGEKETKSIEERPVAKWEPTVEGYLKFLVDSKLVYDTLEHIIEDSNFPTYAEFKNTGLERAESLAKDLEWFKEQGYEIPEPSTPGKTYSQYLKDLAEKDPQAFICHFYNIYFAHSAGGRMIGRKVAETILDNKELEFYKWNGKLSELLQNVREKLDKVAEEWTREEKNDCLEETEKSFKYSDLIRDIKDPENSYSLEELKVVTEDSIEVDDSNSFVRVTFTATNAGCEFTHHIGLCILVKLLRSLPARYKIDVRVAPGTHKSEAQVNKQLNDKERVAAALEKPHLLEMIDHCLLPSFK